MKFAIITHVEHKSYLDKWYAYEPYVREMNIWTKYMTETKIIAPTIISKPLKIDSFYSSNSLDIIDIPSFNLLNFVNFLLAIIRIPIICYRMIKVFVWADHIHLRCPGNIGMIGAVLQIFFPSKIKTSKYAGNWDPKSNQPITYKFQKWILSNKFLTKNMKVLVYGNWDNQSKNVIPFFTASYSEKEKKTIPVKSIKNEINFIFVGTFSKGKQPMLSVKTIEELRDKGYNVRLNMYGEGEEFSKVKKYIETNELSDVINLHGNKSKEEIKIAFQKSHFLLFISKSEGWPKVVAEAMFWSCLPISSKVSCVPYMLGNGIRGGLINSNNQIVPMIEKYLLNDSLYSLQVENARNWSQRYTLEKFEKELKNII